mmetsp:Transcript_18681/g.33801  ORF Transcript_18681/g.33801 Transcript_18681/m.33801 type:complete len:324 (-) Transcript_18681:182-1153(-)
MWGLCYFAPLLLASGAYIEGYWESWNMDKTTDYASSFSKIIYGAVGSGAHLNVVDLSFGDYTFGRDSENRITIGAINDQTAPDGHSYNVDKLKADINAVHSKGGIVKLSFGGADISMSHAITSNSAADKFVEEVVAVVAQNDFDGVDFDVEDGKPSAELQVYLFNKLRASLPSHKTISYTIPALAEKDEPYKEVLEQAGKSFSAVNVMAFDVYWSGYNAIADFKTFVSLGIPMNKIVWGIMPGCSDDPNEFTSVDTAKKIAQEVLSNGLKGAMFWSLNRDTNHRSQRGCLYETNQPDATYTNIFASAFRGTQEPEESHERSLA